MIHGTEIMNALMTVTVMFFLNALKTAGDCPRYCECKWKSGKESVLCANANMTEIPRHLDSGTQLLDLTGNRIQSIGPDEFFNASLLNLQKIFLSRCRLRFIEKSSFRKIINLVELDLSHNELHSVPSHTFEFIAELRELRLNGNPIVRVLNNAFKMVPRLTKLDLSECRIGYVEMKAFQGLEISLEWLKLDKNKIVNIKPFALVNLKNLHGLELSGNPWNCSCELRLLREWMTKRNVPYGISPVCRHPPRIADKDWDKLDLDEFACPPRIEAVASREEGVEGGNVTMSCAVRGNPEPRVLWLRKNHVLANSSGEGDTDRPRIYIVRSSKETSRLTIPAAELPDGGSYVCRAENKAGRSEANITLTMRKRPPARVWSSKMIAAVGAVSLLFALAVALLAFCAWSSRKRKFDFRHPVCGGRDYDPGNYEMNHKKPIAYNKILSYGNHFRPNSTANNYEIVGKNSRGRNPGERTPEGYLDQVGDFSPSSVTSGSGLRDGKIWRDPSGKGSSRGVKERTETENSGSNSRMSPDLHIPRLKGQESLKSSPNACEESNFPEKSSRGSDKMTSSKSFLSFDLNAEPRSFHPGKPTTTESLTHYSSVQGGRTRAKYPDLLELSKNTENLINNNNSFCTIPRNRSYKMKKTLHGSRQGSESESPLLPGSSAESCDSNFSSGRRPSVESGGLPKTINLPASPGNLNRNLILNVLEESPAFPNRQLQIDRKSWELEKFLMEYRSLQDQLYKMKKSCEDEDGEDEEEEEEEEEGNLQFRNSSAKLINSNCSSDPVSAGESFYRFRNEKFREKPTLFDTIRGIGREEDNNNPKSILKNGRPEEEKKKAETVLVPRESFRSSKDGESVGGRGGKLVENLTEIPDSENSLYES